MAHSDKTVDVTKKYFSMQRVCSGSAGSVRVLSIRGFFELARATRLVIPLFQRRYCWEEKHWSKLLQDILKQTTSKRKHAFNRMQTAQKRQDRLEVIDGQQRLTTFNIFLAAVRDVFSHDPASVAEINSLLFPGGVPDEVPAAGKALKSAVTPGYFDRLPFYLAILPQTSPSTDEDQITLAYRFFCKNLRNLPSHITAKQLTSALLDNCTMLNFGIHDSDIMTVYEMMAVHNHTWGGPGGKAMAETDLIKNFFLSQFQTEEDQIKFYEQVWLRLEARMVSGGDQTRSFDKLFEAFLKHMSLDKDGDDAKTNQKFDLYNDVQKAVYKHRDLHSDMSHTESMQKFVGELLIFSKHWSLSLEESSCEESNFIKSA